MKWKSPRCSFACWDEIKKHDAELSKALMALIDMRRDRDEWKEQHENLLAMYRAAVAATAGWREALEDIATLKVTGGAAANRAQAALDTVVSRPNQRQEGS